MAQSRNLILMSSNNSKKEKLIKECTFWENKNFNNKEAEEVNKKINLEKSLFEDYSDDPMGH